MWSVSRHAHCLTTTVNGAVPGWGELVGKIVELYAIDVVTRKPHKVIGAIGGIRHVKEAVRMGSEAIVANLPAMPVSVPLPDVYAIGEYINTETIGVRTRARALRAHTHTHRRTRTRHAA